MRGLAISCGLVACWSSATPPPIVAPPAGLPSRFEITLERTVCFGRCPVYTVTLDSDGRVRWRGDQFVDAIGERHGNVGRQRVRELEAAVDRVKFFERDKFGEFGGMACTTHGKTMSCESSTVICSDTSRAIVTVRRDGKAHTIDNGHCEASPLDELEAQIDTIANTRPWIGRHAD